MTPDVDAARRDRNRMVRRSTVPGGGTDSCWRSRLRAARSASSRSATGARSLPIAGACDYKRAGDGDTGPNTGGMGAYSPPAGFPDDLYDRVRERILAPVLRGLLAEGEEYVGVLYCGLMWTRRTARASSSSTRASAIRRRRC